MTNIGIVILNYLAYDVTLKCVEYFKKQTVDNINVKIVVVDNSSPNASFDILKDKLSNYEGVKVVKTPKNLGFANGNNFGYKELCKDMEPDFVIASNSDAYVKNDGLYDWIIKNWRKYHFGVLGPSVYSVHGKFYQSPMENEERDRNKIFKTEIVISKNIAVHYIKSKFANSESKVSNLTAKWENPFYNEVHFDKTLHGAFQIFSKLYLNKFNNLYDENTFMYMEEHILRIRCELLQLPMVYSPDYKIYHLQAVSTNSVSGNPYKKLVFREKNTLKSLRVYSKYCKLLERKV